MEENPILLDVPPSDPIKIETFKRFDHPIWTENKAKLIERYLYYFVWVTKHGTYLDLFAGPQRENQPSMWSAKLVMDSRPAYLKNFFLFEENPRKVEMLRTLVAKCQRENAKRFFNVYGGDCNESVSRMLRDFPIKDTEATFCLLDQRTFECDWDTVRKLARHKQSGLKIELFYFLANAWIDRVVGRTKGALNSRIPVWWGGDDWESFFKLPCLERPLAMMSRFKNELAYKHVYPFPIYQKRDGGRTMYWMIHATDHPVAPRLMHQAYRNALNVEESAQQLDLLAREVETLSEK